MTTADIEAIKPLTAEELGAWPTPYTRDELLFKRRTLDELRRIYAEGRDPSMKDGDWEDLRSAINEDERWFATLDAMTVERDEANERAAVLVEAATEYRKNYGTPQAHDKLWKALDNLPASAKALLRTPGTVEVCEYEAEHHEHGRCKYQPYEVAINGALCRREDCPIKKAMAQQGKVNT